MLNLEIVEKISNVVKVPLILSGGVGKLEHLNFLKDIKSLDAVAVGSSLHYSALSTGNIKKYLQQLSVDIRC
jgi:cyclase